MAYYGHVALQVVFVWSLFNQRLTGLAAGHLPAFSSHKHPDVVS